MLDKPGAGAGHSVMQSWEAGFSSCGKEARFMELPPTGFLLFSSLLCHCPGGPLGPPVNVTGWSVACPWRPLPTKPWPLIGLVPRAAACSKRGAHCQCCTQVEWTLKMALLPRLPQPYKHGFG